MKKSITSILSLSSQTFVSCPETGIPIFIHFPPCNLDFEYVSPFSYFSNIKKIASLPSVELKALPKPILAGVLLGILKHHSLVRMNDISATEANAFFQILPSSLLISGIRLFSSPFSSSTLSILPTLSLSSLREEVEHSTKDNILSNYIAVCKEHINPTPSQTVSVASPSLPSYIKKVTISTLTPALRAEAKELVKEVLEDEMVTPKLALVLKELVKGDNLITVDSTIRAKITERLLSLQTEKAAQLAKIINDVINNAHLSEKIKNDQINNDLSRASDDFAIVKTRKSLAEILAANINMGK